MKCARVSERGGVEDTARAPVYLGRSAWSPGDASTSGAEMRGRHVFPVQRARVGVPDPQAAVLRAHGEVVPRFRREGARQRRR